MTKIPLLMVSRKNLKEFLSEKYQRKLGKRNNNKRNAIKNIKKKKRKEKKGAWFQTATIDAEWQKCFDIIFF